MLSKTMKLGVVVMRGGWRCREFTHRTLNVGPRPFIVHSRQLSAVVSRKRFQDGSLTSSTSSSSSSRDLVHGSSLGPIRLFSAVVSLRNVAALNLEKEFAATAVVDDPLIRNAANPENAQPQHNLFEEVTNSSDEAAIDVVEAAIDDVLRVGEVEQHLAQTIEDSDIAAAVVESPTLPYESPPVEVPADAQAVEVASEVADATKVADATSPEIMPPFETAETKVAAAPVETTEFTDPAPAETPAEITEVSNAASLETTEVSAAAPKETMEIADTAAAVEIPGVTEAAPEGIADVAATAPVEKIEIVDEMAGGITEVVDEAPGRIAEAVPVAPVETMETMEAVATAPKETEELIDAATVEIPEVADASSEQITEVAAAVPMDEIRMVDAVADEITEVVGAVPEPIGETMEMADAAAVEVSELAAATPVETTDAVEALTVEITDVIAAPVEVDAAPVDMMEVGDAAPLQIMEAAAAAPVEPADILDAAAIEITGMADVPIQIEELAPGAVNAAAVESVEGADSSPVEMLEVFDAAPVEVTEVAAAAPVEPLETLDAAAAEITGVADEAARHVSELAAGAVDTAGLEIVEKAATAPVESMEVVNATPIEITEVIASAPVETMEMVEAAAVEVVELTEAAPAQVVEAAASAPVEASAEVVSALETEPLIDSQTVESTAAQSAPLPDAAIISDSSAAGAVQTAVAPEQIISASVDATASATESVNILSSAAVDPSLIPLPPLPPIALPIPKTDLPFAELGLNSWWPPGWVQWALEYAHDALGLPWWSSIVLTAVALRIVTVPLFAYSQRMVAKNSTIMPKFMELHMKSREASTSGDWQKKMRADHDLARFTKSSGYNPLSTMKPALVQMPIFVSVYWALRGMVGVPVESLKHEGLFWFTNLTVCDPYYLLPLFNSLSLWLQMELGVEMMSASKLSGKQKWIMRAIPLALFPFMCFQSSALLIYWSTSIWMAFVLKAGLSWEPARKYFNLPKVDTSEILKKSTSANQGPVTYKGFKKDIKKNWSKYKSSKTAAAIEKRDETRWREAGLKGAVKTYKYDPTKVKRDA